MTKFARILKPVVAAVVLPLALAVVLAAQLTAQDVAPGDRLDRLFAQLAEPDQPDWQRIQDEIWAEWSRSGSDSMDLLLERGRDAMANGNLDAAIEHFTALIDHAPDFAEGWNARATAYFNAGLYGPSIADIERTLALNPRHFGALAGLALIFEELGYPKEALQAFRRAAELNPHAPDVKEGIARLEKEAAGTDL